MKLEIRSPNLQLPSETRRRIERRIAFGLRRVRGQVKRLTVWIEDHNGPKGGLDLDCRIELRPWSRRIDPIRVTNRGRDLLGTVDGAADRLVSRFKRSVQKRRSLRRRIRPSQFFPERGLLAGV